MEFNVVTPSLSDSHMNVSQTIDVAPHTPMASTPIDVRNSEGLDYLNNTSFNDTPATNHVTSPKSAHSESEKSKEVRKSGRCPRKKNLFFECQSSKLMRRKGDSQKNTDATSVSLLSPSSSCPDTSDVVSLGSTDLSSLSIPGEIHKVF